MRRATGTKVLLGVLSLLALMLFFLSLLTGPADLSPIDSLRVLVSPDESALTLVMWEIRLPRALLGLMIGASLGLSGAVLQGYLRNPLAEPGLLGVSASASLGAVIAIHSGLAAAFALALPLMALLGALASVLALHLFAGRTGSALTVILAGVALSSLAGAMTSLVLNLSSNPFAALEIVFWMLGSLADRSMVHVYLAAPFMLAGWALLAGLGRMLDTLTLGPDTASSMGTSMRRLGVLATFGTALSVGAATAVAGAIGFVGLIVPHLLRPLVGSQPSRLLPASALGGACLLLAADVAVRLIAPERDLKLGVLTAAIGAPFFLWLVIKHRRAAS
ncbi:FecCD family ABC transporter permease [Georhizobium sp. MAB10]|jgi:iron complex transport system permease protein|uniref:FecCD family ABC transporter permease n=1 Tax=Georhizobium sp. MAB10 TaxID=3028319 RepID=UPI0038556786